MNSIFIRYLYVFFRWPIIVAALLVAASSCHCAAASGLGQYHSEAGETRDAFVVRIAGEVFSYTEATGHEVCGAIYTTDTGYTVSVETSHRNDECALPGDTSVYLHTHPINQGLGFSRADYVRPGYLITGKSVKFQAGGRPVTLTRR